MLRRTASLAIGQCTYRPPSPAERAPLLHHVIDLTMDIIEMRRFLLQ